MTLCLMGLESRSQSDVSPGSGPKGWEVVCNTGPLVPPHLQISEKCADHGLVKKPKRVNPDACAALNLLADVPRWPRPVSRYPPSSEHCLQSLQEFAFIRITPGRLLGHPASSESAVDVSCRASVWDGGWLPGRGP
ncbi:unnamed protein product [Arctogadus glacialis]